MNLTPSQLFRRAGAFGLVLLGALTASIYAPGCAMEPDPADMEQAAQPRVRFYFNNTGTRNQNGINHETDDMLIQHIDRAQTTIDFAIMGFSRREVVEALVRAHYRGVRLRFVGDGRHLEHHVSGYQEMERLNIPSVSGNMYHIMHNKFFIIDDRFVITGTGNITPTGYDKNVNNYAFIDSPFIAADFKAEFEQMFSGRFGAAKVKVDNGNTYEVGDTRVEVFFSPQEDAMGRILEYVNSAEHSIHFMIFAFTKDEIGSSFIDKHLAFSLHNKCCNPDTNGNLDEDEQLECEMSVACGDSFDPKGVFGMIDKSQLHSNGPYHEAYRMLMFGLDLRLDGGDNSFQPGDYQAGGGRLHAKTMIIDAGKPTAKVLTGSFNWSSSATIANDETFMVFHGERAAQATLDFWETQWVRGKRFGVDYIGKTNDNENLFDAGRPCGEIRPGDVVFNEIHWDGWNGENDPSDLGGDDVSNDEFIELLNTTDCTIDLSMWTVGTRGDFVTGLYPGTVIGPRERFLLVDHNLSPFIDTLPHDRPSAFTGADFVMNGANDPRFIRLQLRNANFYLQLIDPRGRVMDEVGNEGPLLAGGREFNEDGDAVANYSMERLHPIKDGTKASSWARCDAKEGGAHVLENYRSIIIATPGEPNSRGEDIGDEVENFRFKE